jgi:hypothetical protein
MKMNGGKIMRNSKKMALKLFRYKYLAERNRQVCWREIVAFNCILVKEARNTVYNKWLFSRW